MSRPESVSSRIASFGSSRAIWKISLRFFSPPEKPSLTARFKSSGDKSITLSFSRTSLRNCIESSSSSPRALRCALSAAQEIRIVDPGNFDRVLERQEHAGGGALFRRQLQQVAPLERHRTVADLVALATGQYIAQGGFAGAIRPHDGVHLAGLHFKRKSLEDVFALDAGMQIFDLQHV